MSKVASTLLPVSATMSNEISSFGQSRNKFDMFNLFRLCRKDEISFDIVAVCCKKVECCFDKVERSFDNVVCCFDVVAGVDRTLGTDAFGLLVSLHLKSLSRFWYEHETRRIPVRYEIITILVQYDCRNKIAATWNSRIMIMRHEVQFLLCHDIGPCF